PAPHARCSRGDPATAPGTDTYDLADPREMAFAAKQRRSANEKAPIQLKLRATLLETIRLLLLVLFQPSAIGILKFGRSAVARPGLPFDSFIELPEFGVRSS